MENSKVKILIVDDKESNLFALEELLALKGRHFFKAINGNDALKLLLNENIDLILLDVNMPGMDGFEVAQIIKSNRKTKDIPIVFTSAERKEREYIMKGFQGGAVDYISKPLDPDITRAKVEVLLKIQLQNRELSEKNKILEKYELLINNSADLICIIDPVSLVFEEVNNAFQSILGYALNEIRGTSINNYIHKADVEKIKELKEKTPKDFSIEIQFHCKNKEVKWLNWRVIVKDGKWFANAMDITRLKKSDLEIKQLNADLQQNLAQLEISNKELESFSYSISHDLRAPLRAINGYIQIIQEDYNAHLDEELKRMLGIILKNAKRMDVLINDLLNFSRLGRKKISKAVIDFNKLVLAVLHDLERTRKLNDFIKVHSLPPTEGDPSLLHQVFINLISNAIKYSSKKTEPQIEINSIEKEDEYVYYVKDNGTGFDMSYSNKLFGVFQRLHHEDEFEGTGVGLAIVKRVVAKHGGSVWAEAESGKGATFYFSLPKPACKLNNPVAELQNIN